MKKRYLKNITSILLLALTLILMGCSDSKSSSSSNEPALPERTLKEKAFRFDEEISESIFSFDEEHFYELELDEISTLNITYTPRVYGYKNNPMSYVYPELILLNSEFEDVSMLRRSGQITAPATVTTNTNILQAGVYYILISFPYFDNRGLDINNYGITSNSQYEYYLKVKKE